MPSSQVAKSNMWSFVGGGEKKRKRKRKITYALPHVPLTQKLKGLKNLLMLERRRVSIKKMAPRHAKSEVFPRHMGSSAKLVLASLQRRSHLEESCSLTYMCAHTRLSFIKYMYRCGD